MAKNVTVQVTGGAPKVIEASKVSEALAELSLSGNYTATVNGRAADMSDDLADYSFVTFSEAVKGGL